ncbi:hypothetical protein JAAARDRAFT_38112 [Jaapia argillacea MUCL 33604]|uniref:Uncharacterized protein n=1 Tax=Jaapia argillacea MUCL 33604 TaxID=933084 RepID=A0A067PXD8_9AGAM|nr:hypothetical protein JAAARDRAFT_38112 [Jaapia argillacea MUCL 33604]
MTPLTADTDPLLDLPKLHEAMNLLFGPRVEDAAEYICKVDPKRQRLYTAHGFAAMKCMNAFLTFERKDLLDALQAFQHDLEVINRYRKPSLLANRLAGMFLSVYSTTGRRWIRSMTVVELHAELAYAEALFANALVALACASSWTVFFKEAFHMMTGFKIYMALGKFVEEMDAQFAIHSEGSEDPSIDVHFRSGICFGVGIANLILSLIPSKLRSIVKAWDCKADRRVALDLLAKPGGWSEDHDQPSVEAEVEGFRRSFCDMSLGLFHMAFPSVVHNGVDIKVARKIVEWNVRRFPDSFFASGTAGRLHVCQVRPSDAIRCFKEMIERAGEFYTVRHMSNWEIALANLSLWDIEESKKSWKYLVTEATWSRATYVYGYAVCLLESGDVEEATKQLDSIPQLAAKSIPQEISRRLGSLPGASVPYDTAFELARFQKFAQRKAQKFKSQARRLMLPGLELAYINLALMRAPPAILAGTMLPLIRRARNKLKGYFDRPDWYENGRGYWDDLCLACFLEGVCASYVAYSNPDAHPENNDETHITREAAEALATDAFECAIANGKKIEVDHYLLYHAYFEYARLLSHQNKETEARCHLNLILSGKSLEASPSARKGKYSMQTALKLRARGALTKLDQGKPL